MQRKNAFCNHDDTIRENSYDKAAENVLIEAQIRNWTVANMKEDFRRYARRHGLK
ncbi:MAG: hypothetical protein ACR2IS_01665 [Nitrososphaeraceae archaeon]